MKLAEKFFLTVIVFLLYSSPINCNASDFITKTSILTPVADTYVYQFGTTAPFSETELRVGCQEIGDTKDGVISLLRFDISEISEPSRIKSALLHVYAPDIKAARDFPPFQAIAALKKWTESDPAYPIESLSGKPVYNSRFINGISGTSPDLYLWDITDLVQAWIDGRPNYGIVLTADLEKASGYTMFYSSENPLYKPCIKIMYDVPETPFTTESGNESVQGNSAVEISNTGEIVESDPEDLTVKEAVSIIDHPASQSQEAGKAVRFQVRTAGSGPLSFQWKKNHIDIQGANSESYAIKSVQKSDEGIYSCEVSNDFSNDISDNAKLTVTVLSQIQTPPSPENEDSVPLPEDPINDSENASLAVKAEKGIEVTGENADHPAPVEASSEKETESEALSADESQITDPPEILSQPAAQTKNPGESVTFSVSVSGTEPFAYQWKKDGTDVDGATAQSHTVDAVSEKDEGGFSCMISNDAGSVLSDSARLSVNDPVQITSHPDSQTRKSGESVTFSVSVSGTGPFEYQWKKDGTDIPFAAIDSITLSPVKKEDAGVYSCEISNDFSRNISNDAMLKINDPPTILSHPAAQTKNPGESVTFSVSVSGTGPLDFQWQTDEQDIDGAINQNYIINAVSEKNEGSFSCIISNDAGSVTSESARLSVNDPVQITSHPGSQARKSGESVTFSVSASGTGPFEYQWKKDGTDIPFATIDSITLSPVKKEDAGVYSCEVSNGFSRNTSNDAMLRINDPPTILSHPAAQTKNPGESVTFSVSVSGTEPFAYQWKKDGIDIPYAISDSITLSSVKKEDAGIYACEVSNEFSTAVSDDAGLSIIEVPVPAAKESEESSDRPTDKPESIDLRLSAPTGQGQYVRNGNTLTFEGTAGPGMTLVLAHLEDDQGFLIRDVSKAVTIDTETGHISGAAFVGSFRSAPSVRLHIRVLDDLAKKTVTGLSNTLLVDNTDPEIIANTPADQSTFKSAPIIISGLAVDSISGIAAIEISMDGGASYRPVDSFANGRWQYLFTPSPTESMYTIKARATDAVGRATVSDSRVVYYKVPSQSSAPSPSIQKTALQPDTPAAGDRRKTSDKYSEENGIGTYRIISMENNNFQPSDLFTLDEEMAIIVKGYGGEVVTLELIDPAAEKVVFELSDYIPANKNKMWKWKLSKTGIFKATLFIGGSPRDNVFFKIIK